ncbi:hypothetical protein MKX01_009220 [Papaver californicum]|nr:hypothetical protein MKX01_009220 [Papaver californicum]
MARANMMGWVMLVVVVMALYVGKAQGFPCIYDCASEQAQEHGGSAWSFISLCYDLCSSNSFFSANEAPQWEYASNSLQLGGSKQ